MSAFIMCLVVITFVFGAIFVVDELSKPFNFDEDEEEE
jgi:hypothetical protein